MGFLWFGYGCASRLLLVSLRFCYRFTQCLLWFPYGFARVWLWFCYSFYYGCAMVSLRSCYSFAMVHYGFAMVLLWLCIAALVFWVCLQGAFGYLTVSLKLWPQVVTTHLMSGFLTTVIVWLLYFKIKDIENPSRTPWNFSLNTKRLINLSLIFVTIQIFLGAWTSTNYASISCADLPLCRGQLLPPADFSAGFNFFQTIGPNYLGGLLSDEARVAIHLTHRLGSIIVTLVLSSLIFVLYKQRLLKVAAGLAGVLALQISLGISNVIFSLPLLVAVGHNLGGLLLITYLCALRFRD